MYIVRQNSESDGKIEVFKTVKDNYDPKTAKTIATVTLLNLIQLEVTDQDDWIPPTDLQIDNLRRVFGVDIQQVKDEN